MPRIDMTPYLSPAEREALISAKTALRAAEGTTDELKSTIRRLEKRARKRREREQKQGALCLK